MSKRLSRRTFLKSSLIGGSALGLSAKSYRAIASPEPPSERVRVAMIGVGNQGGPTNNLKYFLKNVVALCDLDQEYLARASDFLRKETNVQATTTDDYRRILDAKDIDAVVVTVPDQWHALMTIDACRAGKDVYCEKPLTLVIAEGAPMIDAARQNNRIVQTGSIMRSGAEFEFAVGLLRKGIIGNVQAVNVSIPIPNWIERAGRPVPDSAPPAGFDFNRWLGPAPLRAYNKNRVHYLFRFFWDYSGGQQTNFGAHYLDIAQWGLGMDQSGPISAEGSAVFNPNGWYETPDTTEIKYTYANGVVLTCRQTPEAKGPKCATEFVGNKGSLCVYRGGITTSPRELLDGIELPRIVYFDANYNHVNDFLDCIKTRKVPRADVAIGHRSATVCHLGNIAVRIGRKIQWNPAAETIVGDAEASKWLAKEYRKPWTLG